MPRLPVPLSFKVPAVKVVLPPKVLAAVKFRTPAPPLVSVVDAPMIKPTVPEVMGFNVTDCVASMLNTERLVALTPTLLKPAVPPPTADARFTSPVPAVIVKALAAVVAVMLPVTPTLAPASKVLSNKKLLPAPDNTTLPL